jgi:hypothetical protein
MSNDVVIKILEIIVAVVASSGIVAYFFNKRLKRLASYEKITNEIMSRMLIGIEQVLSNAKHLDESVEKIEDAVSTSNLSVSQLRDLEKELLVNYVKVKQTLDAHRIYITPLMPMGGSTTYAVAFTAMKGWLELLIDTLCDSNKSEAIEEVKAIRKEASRCHGQYQEMCKSIAQIMNDINSGKPIY